MGTMILQKMHLCLFVAMVDSGSGPRPLNNILSAVNVPAVSESLLKRHERVVGPAIEAIAKRSCAKYIEQEKQLTVETASSSLLVQQRNLIRVHVYCSCPSICV